MTPDPDPGYLEDSRAPPHKIPCILVFPDCDPVPVAHREVRSTAGINRKDFSRSLEIGAVVEGLALPSTGWWNSLLLPQGTSNRPLLGLLLETRCLAQCVPSLQASCFLPYPLSAQKGAISEPIPTSLPARRLAVDPPGETTTRKEARGSGGFISLSSVSPCPQEAFRLWEPLGCG